MVLIVLGSSAGPWKPTPLTPGLTHLTLVAHTTSSCITDLPSSMPDPVGVYGFCLIFFIYFFCYQCSTNSRLLQMSSWPDYTGFGVESVALGPEIKCTSCCTSFSVWPICWCFCHCHLVILPVNTYIRIHRKQVVPVLGCCVKKKKVYGATAVYT